MTVHGQIGFTRDDWDRVQVWNVVDKHAALAGADPEVAVGCHDGCHMDTTRWRETVF